MKRPLEYRQPIYHRDGKFKDFHHWGILDIDGDGKTQWVSPLTYAYQITDPADSEQYTGLKDRNGVKVYDGDLISIDKNKPTEANAQFSVEFSTDGMFILRHYTYRNTLNVWGSIARAIDLEDRFGFIFVVGNIHTP